MIAPRILVVGDVMLDVSVQWAYSRPSPEYPDCPVMVPIRRRLMPGGAARVAAYAEALGARVSLFGVIGHDRAGRRLADRLGAVDARLLVDDGRPTTVKRRISLDGSPHCRLDRESIEPIGPSLADALAEKVVADLDGARALAISDYAKGVLTPGLLRRVIDAARARGIHVICDPKAPDIARYAGATVLTPNDAEASILPPIDEMLGHVSAVLRKRGPAGMTLHMRGVESRVWPAEARRVRDVCGAGDAVTAGLAVGLAAGSSLESACALASHAAARVVEGRPIGGRSGRLIR